MHAGLSREPGVASNPHLHLVFSERVNDGVERAAEQWFRRAAPAGRDPASGGARKSERTKPREWLQETRQAWAAEMNLAFGRAGVADRVTAESHAAQLARAREAGDAAEEQRLLLNPPSEHIGPAAKHRWEDRSGTPEQKPDRYTEYEQASAAAREVRLAHARDAAEAAEARRRIETLDVKIAALEAEQRRAEAAARRRKEAAARREAEKRRDEAKWKAKAKDREAALGLLPGGVELYLAHLADIDPKWNVNGNHATTRGNVDAALGAAESDARRLERLRGVLTDEAAAARYRQQLGKGAGRVGTADLDEALAPAEALRRRVSRLGELFAAPGGDAALFTALEDRSPSWPRTATPIDIERALGVAGRSRRRQAATWEHRVVLEAEQQFPDVLERGVATNGRALRRVHRYRPPWQAPHADALGSRPRACHRRRAARAAGPARFGEAALRVGAGARSEDAAQASPVESRASSGSFSGQRCPAGTGRRGRAGAARAAPGPQADHGRPRRRPEVGRHPPSYGHRRLCRRVDQRPAGDGRGSPSGPRTDQLGDGTLGRSLDRGCRTETPLPRREGRGGRPAPSAGPQGVGGPIMAPPPDGRKTETRASRPAEPA